MLDFDYILIEQPGSGQINTKISSITDVLVVVLQPLLGDDIQILKAGLTELGDIYVLNKADLPQAELYYALVKPIIEDMRKDDWTPPLIKVCSTSCINTDILVNEISKYLEYLRRRDLLLKKRLMRRILRER